MIKFVKRLNEAWSVSPIHSIQFFFEQHFAERKHIVRHFSISLHFTLLYQEFVYA